MRLYLLGALCCMWMMFPLAWLQLNCPSTWKYIIIVFRSACWICSSRKCGCCSRHKTEEVLHDHHYRWYYFVFMGCQLNARIKFNILFSGSPSSSSDFSSCKFLNSLLFSAAFLLPFCLQCVYISFPLYYLFIYYHEIRPVNDLFQPWNYVWLVVSLNAAQVSNSDASEVRQFFSCIISLQFWYGVTSFVFCILINCTMLYGSWI